MLDDFGPTVILIQELYNGDRLERVMPACFAVGEALHSPANGVTVKSARIIASKNLKENPQFNLGLWDGSG
ncbi:MAG TPA: hypothetical protein PKD55_02430 [Bellilinea sp.]|mgnify:CR=1 FL=1|nr:hypothetical protein [Bellilinea sp.]